MADVTDGEFGYSDAVSALENLEFSANVGQLRPKKISQGHCPAIIELKGGKTAVLTSVDANKDYTLYDEKTFYLSGLMNVSKHLAKKFNLSYKKNFLELKKNFLKKATKNLLQNILKKKKIYNETNLNTIIKLYRYHNFKIHL